MSPAPTETVTCPGCGLINPPSAVRCDCGVDLRTRSRGAIDKVRRAQLDKPLRRRALGIWLMVFGTIPVFVGVVGGSHVAVFGLLNLPFLIGLFLTIGAHKRVRELQGLEPPAELPEAKTVPRK